MLVLSRKLGQRILIGENITVVVSRISGGRVQLSIDAPKEVPIQRRELRQTVAELSDSHCDPIPL
jgi:carbon storage regulator